MADILRQLIEKLPPKKLTSILKRCDAGSKTRSGRKNFNIAGFNSPEKVPLPFLCNKIASDKKLRYLFLKSVAIEYGVDIDIKGGVEKFDEVKTDSNLYGIVAVCLLKEDEVFNRYAENLLNEQNQNENKNIPLEIEEGDNPKTYTVIEEKKEERFREKFLELQKEVERLRKDNVNLKDHIQKIEKTLDEKEECIVPADVL